jgi:hypothetical protein
MTLKIEDNKVKTTFLASSTKQSDVGYGLGHGLWHSLEAWPLARPQARPQARHLGPRPKKVMAMALSTAVSTKEGDGDGLEQKSIFHRKVFFIEKSFS